MAKNQIFLKKTVPGGGLLYMKSIYRLVIVLLVTGTLVVAADKSTGRRVDGGKISVEFNDHLYSRIITSIGGNEQILGPFSLSEFIALDNGNPVDFKYDAFSSETWKDEIGQGKQFTIRGISDRLSKELIITSYDEFPTLLFFMVRYKNTGKTDLKATGWTNNQYNLSALPAGQNDPLFWSYQPGSYGWENDWIQPLKTGFERENYMGMNWVDYGGGTPVVDLWRNDVGLAVGHIEKVPKLVSLPVSVTNDNTATLSVTFKTAKTLKAGETFSTFRTFVAVHRGDHFQTLSEYSRFMGRQGLVFRDPPKAAYETIWCGWGYEKNFTLPEFYGTFPMVRKLGIDWIVLDYGWDTGVGDYHLDPGKFPNGDADMKKLVADIHAVGAKAKLWWMPLSVHPCTDMFQNHTEYLLRNTDGSPVFIEFWKSFFLCPASDDVRRLTREFVIKAIRDWGWDGLKIDGNNLNSVPPCFNPDHKHAYPEESVEKLPEFFKMIYETTLSIKPDAVIEICPCGTNYSFFMLPYMNQAVASDPTNSWQIRQKGKTLKALSASKVAYYGDHVELSDAGSDFASTVGIGGVVGTKFVWPVTDQINSESGDINLTPEKEKEWTRWIGIYKNKMLPLGTYRGDLYDIGYDRPEAHVIQKGDTLYYAFYADNFAGQLDLRGLQNLDYNLLDYVNQKNLGELKGPRASLKVSFAQYLLLEAVPR
jgi:alpha-galactosidase